MYRVQKDQLVINLPCVIHILPVISPQRIICWHKDGGVHNVFAHILVDDAHVYRMPKLCVTFLWSLSFFLAPVHLTLLFLTMMFGSVDSAALSRCAPACYTDPDRYCTLVFGSSECRECRLTCGNRNDQEECLQHCKGTHNIHWSQGGKDSSVEEKKGASGWQALFFFIAQNLSSCQHQFRKWWYILWNTCKLLIGALIELHDTKFICVPVCSIAIMLKIC